MITVPGMISHGTWFLDSDAAAGVAPLGLLSLRPGIARDLAEKPGCGIPPRSSASYGAWLLPWVWLGPRIGAEADKPQII